MPKLLGELLQEQQEPFALEVYLLERGYQRGASLDATSTLCNSTVFLKGTANFGLLKRRYFVPNWSKFLRTVLSQITVATDDQKGKNSRDGCGRKARNGNRKTRQENAAEDRLSSASSISVFNTCSESELEDTHCCGKHGNDLFIEKEVGADSKFKWTAVEDSKQLSPVSVLQETESEDGSPLHHHNEYKFKKEQGESSSSTSTSHCKLRQPTHSRVQEQQEIAGSDSYAQYMINKRALQQTKQLLIDCVKEVLECHRRREQVNRILGAEEVWKLVCESVWIWSQDSIHETNTVHLLHCDFLASAEEWSDDYEQQKVEVSIEVGNAILEDVINEIAAW